MKLSWTFYPKGEKAVTLDVVYVPELDKHRLEGGGYLHVDTNTAFVNWDTYRRFDEAAIESRTDAFARLVRLNKYRTDWLISK